MKRRTEVGVWSARESSDRGGGRSGRLLGVVLPGIVLAIPGVVLGQVDTATPASAATAPPFFDSNYVESLTYGQWNSWGCAQAEYSAGEHVSAINLILDFGNAIDRNGEYGTTLVSSNTFAQWDTGTTSGIRFLVANFLTGYWNCRDMPGYGPAPFITLAVGIANSNTNGLSDPTNAEWMAEVIAAINDWISSGGQGGLEYVYGAMDIEMEYAHYSTTVAYEKAVLAGYCNDQGQCSGIIPLYDFGEADCSETSYNASSACGQDTTWTQGQVLDVAFGETGAYPLPEIYNTVGAQATEWYWISKGSIQTGYGPMYFDAELTQYGACSQEATYHHETVDQQCPGTDNEPSAGWNQLYSKISGDPATQPGIGSWTLSDDIRYLPNIY